MSGDESAVSTLEYHVLLAMAAGPLYGYAIKSAIESESGGTLTPRAGSLYRVISRLMDRDWVKEADPEESVEAHPGRPRKYYRLTTRGLTVLSDEAERLRKAAALAEARLAALEGRS